MNRRFSDGGWRRVRPKLFAVVFSILVVSSIVAPVGAAGASGDDWSGAGDDTTVQGPESTDPDGNETDSASTDGDDPKSVGDHDPAVVGEGDATADVDPDAL